MQSPAMLKITVPGLVLAVMALSVAVPAASTEDVPSPLAQARDGVPADGVECTDGRVLMASPSGNPACVFAGSAEALERRGFTLPSEVPRENLSAERSASEKTEEPGGQDMSKTGDRPFVTTWKTTSPNESITIPVGGATGTYTVDWGDGSTSDNVTGDQSHTYGEVGTYTVAVTGNFERIYLNGDRNNAPKLQSIEQWGDISWTSMGSAFYGADNMVYNAADIPDLSGVTDMSGMFENADSFNGNFSAWDVSGVTDMSGMFDETDSFNGDISDWDVSGVTDMSRMFENARFFNGDISDWDVSGVTDMSRMFDETDSFNGDISEWDVSGVTDMSGMFHYAILFNSDISEWDVSNVTDMSHMFRSTWNFNGDISEWDVSGVTDMSYMLFNAPFNGDISDWDVSGVTDMSYMLAHMSSFNGDISDWDVSSVTDMFRMFYSADSFNGDISDWDVSSVKNMKGMLSNAVAFNGDISDWDVSGVTDMSFMFLNNVSFNDDISSWDVSGVTDMSGMFFYAYSFNQNLGNWYIVLDSTSIDIGGGATKIGNIAAQNPILDDQGPAYRMGSGADSALFIIDGDVLVTKPSVDYSGKTGYAVNITSTGDFGTNNFRVINVTVTGAGNTELP